LYNNPEWEFKQKISGKDMRTDRKSLFKTEWMEQPIDYRNVEAGTFKQQISIFTPKKADVSSPVFFIVGNEGPITDLKMKMLYKAYGSPDDIIFFRIEHRGYGKSITSDQDQTVPTYVTVDNALRDYHRVVTKYKEIYTGPWIAAGYSYGGGLSINYGYKYPDDIVGVLSSSGVVDWSFFMDTYDEQVRINLGNELYAKLMNHTENLRPNNVFDDNWMSRELILAYATGFSQYSGYDFLLPLFKALVKLKTKNFVRILKFLDSVFAQRGAKNYAESNSKLNLSHKEALTNRYSWRYWRWQQFTETGVFWKSSEDKGIYQRTLEDLKQECQLLFKVDPPLLDKSIWNVDVMVEELKIPLIYVNGGKDPWKGVCLRPDFPIKQGKYFYFPEGKHCPDGQKKQYGCQVFTEVRKIFNSRLSNTTNLLKSNTRTDTIMIQTEEYVERRAKLQNTIKSRGLDAFLVSQPGSIYYYTGATYKAQERPFLIVIWPEKEPTFLVPKLEEDHMNKAKIGNVLAYWEYPAPTGEGWPEKLSNILKGVTTLGVEPGISLENYNKIGGLQLKSLDLVEKQRLIKSPTEIEMIRNSARYSDMGMKMMMDKAYHGVSVLEMFGLGRKIQMKVIKSKNFDPLNCEFLTATWPAPWSSMPHGVPPIDGKLKSGPLAAMCYLRVNGYAAETERTFFLSEPTEEERTIFNHMRSARQKAFEIIKPGVKCSRVDKAAQDFLKECGYKEYLLHRTGHGIGQGNHEGPWVADGSDHILEENMVISVEPGIYIPELGGFRHSDTVLVTKSGYELLTKHSREIEDLTILKPRRMKKMMGKIIQKAMNI